MISRRLRGITPYVPGEQPTEGRYIKLNTNENPYPPSPRIAELLATYDIETLRRYPDPTFTALRRAVADHHALRPECVFAGNGSDEVLSFAFFSFFDRSVAFPDPSYSFYPVYCDFYAIESQPIPLDESLEVDLAAFAAVAADGIAIANPNSPTGTYLDRRQIESIVSSAGPDRVVVVDEAYIEFGGESCVPLIDKFDNLLVVQTFSKSASLAGLRLGVALGCEELISSLFRAKDAFNSYPVHDLAQRIGVVALEEWNHTRASCDRIITTRERVSSSLASMGFRVLPSKANFLFASHGRLRGGELYRTLRERGILVRYFDSPRLTDFVRVTMGTDDEMDSFLEEASSA